jgi:hypothetical protein
VSKRKELRRLLEQTAAHLDAAQAYLEALEDAAGTVQAASSAPLPAEGNPRGGDDDH